MIGLLPILKDNWKAIAGVVLVLVVFGFGYYKGYQFEKEKFDAFKIQVELEKAKVIAEHERTKRQQVEATQKVAQEYSNAVSKLKTYYSAHPTIKWVQVGRPSVSTTNEVSKTSSGPDATTQSDSVSTEGITPLDCADDVLQLLWLQKWVRDQESIE